MTIGLSHRLRLVKPGTYMHWCPGCMKPHLIEIGMRAPNGKKIGFDGDLQNPSFEPELMVLEGDRVCSYLLRGGRLHFAEDCTHALAGGCYELPHFPLP